MEYYAAAKRNENFIYATTWMGFENIMLGKKNRHKRQVLYGFTTLGP